MKLKPKPTWNAAQVARFNEFMEATKGVPPHAIARAFNRLTWGVDWRGCTKGHLAEVWAEGRKYSAYARVLVEQPIAALRDAIEKEASGRYS